MVFCKADMNRLRYDATMYNLVYWACLTFAGRAIRCREEHDRKQDEVRLRDLKLTKLEEALARRQAELDADAARIAADTLTLQVRWSPSCCPAASATQPMELTLPLFTPGVQSDGA